LLLAAQGRSNDSNDFALQTQNWSAAASRIHGSLHLDESWPNGAHDSLRHGGSFRPKDVNPGEANNHDPLAFSNLRNITER